MTDRYPDYDVMNKQWSQSWNPITRQVVQRRLAVPREPRFFNVNEWETLGAVCDRIMPQPSDRPPIPLPAYVDAKITEKHMDGYRYAALPDQGEAWKRGLAALDQEARDAHGGRFHSLPPDAQDDLLRRMQKGELQADAWQGMPCKPFFEHRVIADITHAYYAHPVAWNEIGFGGPASPRGYVRMQLDRRDPWEAAEAKPGEEARVRRENQRVG
ncbi:gluconate 2-dehydrogenase subunit 3 family protein [Rhodopila sp.]|uniref:gluconate 2-dehydrogenase subunit 3 family protein n=1 Tax=Rhodopila sp. TaxID=2480087 RepID=UPI003D0A390C